MYYKLSVPWLVPVSWDTCSSFSDAVSIFSCRKFFLCLPGDSEDILNCQYWILQLFFFCNSLLPLGYRWRWKRWLIFCCNGIDVLPSLIHSWLVPSMSFWWKSISIVSPIILTEFSIPSLQTTWLLDSLYVSSCDGSSVVWKFKYRSLAALKPLRTGFAQAFLPIDFLSGFIRKNLNF